MTDAKRSLYHELLALSERETIRQLDTALGRFVEEASAKGGAGACAQDSSQREAWVHLLVQLVSARLSRGEISLQLNELSAASGGYLLQSIADCVWLKNEGSPQGGRAEQGSQPEERNAEALHQATPLVLYNKQIYLRRFWQLEMEVSQQLQELEESKRLRVITGPPGSGKTTRLKTLIEEKLVTNPSLRVALAAPTGKAVHRLQQVLPGQANISTLHRLLGIGGQRSLSSLVRQANAQPLAFDLIVVDEASMMGLELARALLNSLLPQAELLLVGDANQLPSVEPGQVFGSLCKRIGAESIEYLQTQYRFKSNSAIGLFAKNLQSHNAQEPLSSADVFSYVATPLDKTVQCITIESTTDTHLVAQVAEGRFQLITMAAAMATAMRGERWVRGADGAITRDGQDPSLQAALIDLLDWLDEAMVLTPFREGPMGSIALNGLFQRALHRRGLFTSAAGFTTGLPVICIENDYDLDLMNGSLGVVVGDMCLFNSSHGPRLIALQQCPSLEPALALTVHKAQGSEFNNLIFLLAESSGNPLSVPLVYTAVTRARNTLMLVATQT
jgi:exodeoxyribonuclease V alpha subunit